MRKYQAFGNEISKITLLFSVICIENGILGIRFFSNLLEAIITSVGLWMWVEFEKRLNKIEFHLFVINMFTRHHFLRPLFDSLSTIKELNKKNETGLFYCVEAFKFPWEVFFFFFFCVNYKLFVRYIFMIKHWEVIGYLLIMLV
jgi:hypothetical protein